MDKTSKPGIFKRGKHYVFVLPFVDAAGKRKQKWVGGFDTLAAADKERTRLRYRRDTGQEISPEKQSLAEYADRWLSYKKSTVEPNTYLAYSDAVKRARPFIGKVLLSALKPFHIRELVEGLIAAKYATSTINQTRSIISRLLAQAVEDELIDRNVSSRVRGPKQGKRDFYLPTKQELNRLLEACDAASIGALARLAVLTGMRIDELLSLTWADVDFDATSLRVKDSKTPAGVRTLSLGPVALALLRGLREEGGMVRFSGPVFAMKRTHRNRPWIAARRAVGLERMHFHDLRHIHASLLIEQGIDFKVIQERLGHASIRTTLDLYGHLRPAADARAAHEIEAAIGP